MTSNAPGDSHPVRVGVIGAGPMGLQHIRAIRAIPNAVLVGVADPQADTERLRELLPPGAEIVSDPAHLCQGLRPDVVHIVTPPRTHAALARLALTAGCHVYVEKPFTPTRAEAEALMTLAAERHLLVCAGHQYLFERPSRLALAALPSIGRLSHVESYFSFRMVRRTISPADQAKDILPHAVYPLLAQLRAGSGESDAPFRLSGLDVRPEGDLFALVTLGSSTGLLIVTLSGRPVEQYQHLVGTKGWLRADYVTGSLIRLLGPGAGIGILFTPYRRAGQTITGAIAGLWRLVFGRKTSYPGLTTLIGEFYGSIRGATVPPLSTASILDTVGLCETIGTELDRVEAIAEDSARMRLQDIEPTLPPPTRGAVLVTGGTGLLGRKVVEELRWAGYRVRAIARREPRWSVRSAGVEYVAGDLGSGLDPSLLANIDLVVHCAAETVGGQADHQRNSIDATRHVLQAAAAAGAKRVIHVSSLAVLKPGREGAAPLDETSPVDVGNLTRGPYVWGKAESEALAQQMGTQLGLDVKVIRPGPLVDYSAFQPPGRLGRELGPLFVAIGGRRTPLSVCDVGSAARVIRSYAERFPEAPPLLNLVEAPPPSRGELAARFAKDRPDLRFVWFPAILLRLLSGPLKLVQRVALGSKKPLDVYAAFASERYRTDLAQSVLTRAGASVVPQEPLRAHASLP